MNERVRILAESMAKRIAKDTNKKLGEQHLTQQDYDMFDRIFSNIEYRENNPEVHYETHFSSKPGWQPNGKVLQKRESKRATAPKRPSLRSLRTVGKDRKV